MGKEKGRRMGEIDGDCGNDDTVAVDRGARRCKWGYGWVRSTVTVATTIGELGGGDDGPWCIYLTPLFSASAITDGDGQVNDDDEELPSSGGDGAWVDRGQPRRPTG
ncbi:hypothetical protein Dimus_033566 [Dionaea muscipula]